MSGLKFIVIAVGALAAAAVLPLTAHAQTGDALAQAENICLESGIGPNTMPFEACVRRAAQAYDRGDPTLAAAEARKAGDASRACLANDVEPMTLAYRQCMAGQSSTITASRYAAR